MRSAAACGGQTCSQRGGASSAPRGCFLLLRGRAALGGRLVLQALRLHRDLLRPVGHVFGVLGDRARCPLHGPARRPREDVAQHVLRFLQQLTAGRLHLLDGRGRGLLRRRAPRRCLARGGLGLGPRLRGGGFRRGRGRSRGLGLRFRHCLAPVPGCLAARVEDSALERREVVGDRRAGLLHRGADRFRRIGYCAGVSRSASHSTFSPRAAVVCGNGFRSANPSRPDFSRATAAAPNPPAAIP